MNLFDRTEWSQKDIEDIIDNQLEESINIEFKSSGALIGGRETKTEMCKDISAFANSDGGLLFYGIEEKDHVASATSFIDGKMITKEWIENVFSSGIQRKIEGLRIYPIRFDNDISKTVYVLKIPVSANAPHQVESKRFYKRYNFQSVAMEEYEVRNIYLRRQQTSLEIKSIDFSCENFDRLVEHGIEKFIFFLHVIIENTGQFPAELYKVVLTIKNSEAMTISATEPVKFTRLGELWQVSSTNHPVLFPSEATTAFTIQVDIQYWGFDLKPESLACKASVFYPGGDDHETFNFTDQVNKLYDLVYKANNSTSKPDIS